MLRLCVTPGALRDLRRCTCSHASPHCGAARSQLPHKPPRPVGLTGCHSVTSHQWSYVSLPLIAITISQSVFESNQAGTSGSVSPAGGGGALYTTSSSSLFLINTTFQNNYGGDGATMGGAVLASVSGDEWRSGPGMRSICPGGAGWHHVQWDQQHLPSSQSTQPSNRTAVSALGMRECMVALLMIQGVTVEAAHNVFSGNRAGIGGAVAATVGAKLWMWVVSCD